MAKLTLSVDPKVVQHAKRYARARRISVSRLVENYLQILGHAGLDTAEPPVLRELRGLLRRGSTSDYPELAHLTWLRLRGACRRGR